MNNQISWNSYALQSVMPEVLREAQQTIGIGQSYPNTEISHFAEQNSKESLQTMSLFAEQISLLDQAKAHTLGPLNRTVSNEAQIFFDKVLLKARHIVMDKHHDVLFKNFSDTIFTSNTDVSGSSAVDSDMYTNTKRNIYTDRIPNGSENTENLDNYTRDKAQEIAAVANLIFYTLGERATSNPFREEEFKNFVDYICEEGSPTEEKDILRNAFICKQFARIIQTHPITDTEIRTYFELFLSYTSLKKEAAMNMADKELLKFRIQSQLLRNSEGLTISDSSESEEHFSAQIARKMKLPIRKVNEAIHECVHHIIDSNSR